MNVNGSVTEVRDELRKSADDGEGENDLMLAHRMF